MKDPHNLFKTLQHLYPHAGFHDFRLVMDNKGLPKLDYWNAEKLGDYPTPEQLDAAELEMLAQEYKEKRREAYETETDHLALEALAELAKELVKMLGITPPQSYRDWDAKREQIKQRFKSE